MFFLLVELLLNVAINAQTGAVINHQSISCCEVLQLILPVVMECSLRKSFQIQGGLCQRTLVKDFFAENSLHFP